MRICPTCSTTYPTQTGFCPKDGSPLAELSEWTSGAIVRGKYRILSTIGQGGMGSVYKALHLGFDELRALKVLHRDLAADARFVKRFQQEAFTTRKLQHPNIVRVEDIDEAEDGQPFIVMEFIEGRSLRRLIEKHGAMRVPAACSLVKQIASALVAAHGLGVVHRDLKPDNIVLVVPEKGAGTQAEPMVKVLDFGIAKLKEARAEGDSRNSLTQTGFILGTPEYMSPEQAKGKRGDDLDGRSDIYSLGILMYQMLTGRLPFEARTAMEMILAHIQAVPQPICAVRPDLQIPEPIANVVMQCLAKNREDRPQTAQVLIQVLEAAAKAPIPAAPIQEIPAAGQAPALSHPERVTAAMPGQAAVLAGAQDAEPAATSISAPEPANTRSIAAVPLTSGPESIHQEQQATPEREVLHNSAGPSASVMIPAANVDKGLTSTPDVINEPQTPIAQTPVSHSLPIPSQEKPPGKKSRGAIWSLVGVGVVLLATIAIFLASRRPAAQQQRIAPQVTPSVIPVTDQKTIQSSGSDAETTTTPAQVSTSVSATPSPSTSQVDLKKKAEAAEADGDLHRSRYEYPQAIHAYQEALKLAPSNTKLRDKIASLEREIKREQDILK